MTSQLVTLAVLFRWLRAKREVAEHMQSARMAVVARQLAEMRGTAPA